MKPWPPPPPPPGMFWLVDPSPEDPIALEEPLADEVLEVAVEELLLEELEAEDEAVGVLKREVAARKADELDGGALRELELWLPDAEDEEDAPVTDEELDVEVVEEPPVLREAAVLMDPKP